MSTSFKIQITKKVTFKDWQGTVTRVYNVGDVIEATYEDMSYFVHSYGGIWKDEAVRLPE